MFDYKSMTSTSNWSSRYISSVLTYDVSPGAVRLKSLDQGFVEAIWPMNLSGVIYKWTTLVVSAGIRKIF